MLITKIDYTLIAKRTLFLKEYDLKNKDQSSNFHKDENDLSNSRFRGNQAGLKFIFKTIYKTKSDESYLTSNYISQLYETITFYEYNDRIYQRKRLIDSTATYMSIVKKHQLESALKAFNEKMYGNEKSLSKDEQYLEIIDFVQSFLDLKPYTHANPQIAMHLLNYLLVQHGIGFCPLPEIRLIKDNTLKIDDIEKNLIRIENNRNQFVKQLFKAVKDIKFFQYKRSSKNPSVWYEDFFDKEDQSKVISIFRQETTVWNTEEVKVDPYKNFIFEKKKLIEETEWKTGVFGGEIIYIDAKKSVSKKVPMHVAKLYNAICTAVKNELPNESTELISNKKVDWKTEFNHIKNIGIEASYKYYSFFWLNKRQISTQNFYDNFNKDAENVTKKI
jgi:hypothetical protein